MKRLTATLAALLICTAAHAGIAPRFDTTIDASAAVTKHPLRMAQAASQDFGFDFTNLQSDLTTNDAVRWYYTAADLSWQVVVTGAVEDADTVLVSVDPAHSNTNTSNDGSFPWRLEVQDAAGNILATGCGSLGCGSLVIPESPISSGQPVLITTTNINTADYTVSGAWPLSSIPDLSSLYETAATNGQGAAGQTFTTDGSGSNYWSDAGAGDITAVNITAGTGMTGTVFTASGDHDQTLALDSASVASLLLADSATQPADLDAYGPLASDNTWAGTNTFSDDISAGATIRVGMDGQIVRNTDGIPTVDPWNYWLNADDGGAPYLTLDWKYGKLYTTPSNGMWKVEGTPTDPEHIINKQYGDASYSLASFQGPREDLSTTTSLTWLPTKYAAKWAPSGAATFAMSTDTNYPRAFYAVTIYSDQAVTFDANIENHSLFTPSGTNDWVIWPGDTMTNWQARGAN